MPKISVIIPVYNVEKYLSRCLDSIVNQTFRDMEIICVNDGCTDNSAEILDQYAKTDKRIKIITQTNGGLSVARNTGLKYACGQYVGFIDSDDWIDIDYYECLVDLLEKNNADIAMAGMRISNQDNVSDNLTPNFVTDDFVKKIQTLPNGSICDKLFKADLFQELTFPVGRYYEDNIVLLKTMYYSKKVVFTNRVSYYYFTNPSGICRTTDKTAVKRKNQDRLYSAEMMMNFAKEQGFDKKHAVKDFIVRTVIVDFISTKSPYYNQVQKILGASYIRNIKFKKILTKIARFFYQNNSKLRILRIPVYKWRKK